MTEQKDFDPKKGNPFLVHWDEEIVPEDLSGDQVADDRLEENDKVDNLSFRMRQQAGSPFMHPMHDASADPYNDELQSSDRREARVRKK